MQRFWGMIDEQEPAPIGRSCLLTLSASCAAIATTWAAREIVGVELPFLFCIAAVLVVALRNGFRGAIAATVLTLIGTTLLADGNGGLVNVRSLMIVSIFCLCLAICGEVLRRVRQRERQAAMRAARREAILQVMFDESAAVTLVVDEDDRIVAANAAAGRLFGVPRTELIGRPASTFVPDAQPADAQRVVAPNGRSLVLRSSEASLAAAERSFRLVYIRDETAIVEAAERLAITQRELHQIARATALGQFGSSIAHELNQPLAFVANYAGAARAMLACEAPNVHAVAQALDDALSQVFRASAVLKRLRDFVARRPPTLAWQPIEHVLGEALRLGALAVKEAGAALTVDLPTSAGQVLADGVQLQQLVVNLLLNATDAVREKERRCIAVRATVSASNILTVAVEDSGHGVPPSEVENVFNPFRSTKSDGVGIGLAICRTIVEAHGGRIWCDADTPLGGARFAFTLQRREQESMSDAA